MVIDHQNDADALVQQSSKDLEDIATISIDFTVMADILLKAISKDYNINIFLNQDEIIVSL